MNIIIKRKNLITYFESYKELSPQIDTNDILRFVEFCKQKNLVSLKYRVLSDDVEITIADYIIEDYFTLLANK